MNLNIFLKKHLSFSKPLLLVLAALASCTQINQKVNQAKARVGEEKEWPVYGGNAQGNRYSGLDQINTQNVNRLQIAWTYHTGDNTGKGTEMQSQPIIKNGILYTASPKLKVLALDAATGALRWQFDPFKDKEPTLHANRGVVYWENGNDKRILFTAGAVLYALNADTGEPVTSFGKNGQVSLYEGLGRDVKGFYIVATTPGIVYQNLLILGSRVSENADAAPGFVRAYNIGTGEIAWVFRTIPQPGEFGHDTWPADAWESVGGANVWSGMSLDEKRGLVFLPTGSASFDFYGGNRPGQNLFANCILAIKAATGERVWHYQTVHHDIWDRDLPCQPNLVTVNHNGKKVDAVAQATKSGFIFLLDRETGKPLFPLEERPVPKSDLPGEVAWPTQPIPLKPAPFARQAFTEADITDISPEAHAHVAERFKQVRSGQPFIPPSKAGTVIFPGFDGGAEWGGNAFDPQSGVLYINSNEMPWILTMVDAKPKTSEKLSAGAQLYQQNCASCHGPDRLGDQHSYPSLVQIQDRLSRRDIELTVKNGRGRMPAFGHIPENNRQAIIDFIINPNIKSTNEQNQEKVIASKIPQLPYTHTGYHRFLDQQGYPAVKPPWGTLNAINLNTGEYLWQVPLGEFAELTKKGIPPTGTENYGGPIVTAGGLVFIGATKDEKFRAFDKKTGKILYETTLPAGGYATPSTYQVNGKQYIVISAGGAKMGTKAGDAIIAFALP
ncbi:pyrroloquinoline quinone-dependent dehydrogenase [Adhaeribacter rhizoryzae]|uniref:Pyrroloquinoline quinone-dependent dehydrogenase n=1 Tax=Adhaeribacter rhizoryzae TaxID=2607907 RepID=A0A5M6DN58_9BACT|nr:pyrroloquinoline quinone-dependent dehydrogenase [Adhaeribacter rhizoryzae]KAA5547689.1 pyrroloquinoline quinone-dependent dehydrogenase [Adhaeribacter rhizoryzae]